MSFDVISIVRHLVAYDTSTNSFDDKIRYCLLPIKDVYPLYVENKCWFENPKTGKEERLEWSGEDDRINVFKKANKIIEECNLKADENNALRLWDGVESDKQGAIIGGDVISDIPYIPLMKKYPLHAFYVELANPYLELPVNVQSAIRNTTKSLVEIDVEILFKTWLDVISHKCLKDDWVSQFNKMIFNHVQLNIKETKELGAWDENNIWNRPNKEFIHWFQIRGIKPKEVPNLEGAIYELNYDEECKEAFDVKDWDCSLVEIEQEMRFVIEDKKHLFMVSGELQYKKGYKMGCRYWTHHEHPITVEQMIKASTRYPK